MVYLSQPVRWELSLGKPCTKCILKNAKKSAYLLWWNLFEPLLFIFCTLSHCWDSTHSTSAFPTDVFRSKAKKEWEICFAASISRAVQTLLHFPFHHSAWVKAHPGPANSQAQGKHPRSMQRFALWEVTFCSQLAFLPLLEVPVLSDPVKGDSCWYKRDKGQDFLPRFPPAGIEAIHRITE